MEIDMAGKPTPVSPKHPTPSNKLWSIWNCPKLAGGEPTSLAFTGPHDQVYPMYVQVSGKNPDPSRTYVMADATSHAPTYAG